MKPIVYDLYCGLGGWTEGFLTEGYDAIGFDIERHDYGTGGYPGQLVIQDVLTLHGKQFKNAAVIVGSSPCQEFSYRAMPWKRAKALPPPYKGIELFQAQFRIQKEASEAAGHHVPMVVENVNGAQPWVGRAKARFGSYYLWGDVEDVGGRIVASGPPVFGAEGIRAMRAHKFNPDGTEHGQGSWFKIADSVNRGAQKQPGRNFHFPEKYGIPSPSFHGADHEESIQTALAIKNSGGSQFGIGSPGQMEAGRNLVKGDGVKMIGHVNIRDGYSHTRHFTNQRESDGVKQHGSGAEWFDKALDERRREATAIKNGKDWFGSGENCSLQRRASSRSNSRKAASALIAKIPLELSRHIARCFYPRILEAAR